MRNLNLELHVDLALGVHGLDLGRGAEQLERKALALSTLLQANLRRLNLDDLVLKDGRRDNLLEVGHDYFAQPSVTVLIELARQ